MTERITNGSFLDGLNGWTVTGPPDDPEWGPLWEVGLNQRSFPDGLPTLGITLYMPGIWVRVSQPVDWTGINLLYGVLACYPCFWSGEPGICDVRIGNTTVWTAQMDMFDLTPIEIPTTEFNGVHDLSFGCYFDSYQAGMDVRTFTTGGPELITPSWQIQIGDL